MGVQDWSNYERTAFCVALSTVLLVVGNTDFLPHRGDVEFSVRIQTGDERPIATTSAWATGATRRRKAVSGACIKIKTVGEGLALQDRRISSLFAFIRYVFVPSVTKVSSRSIHSLLWLMSEAERRLWLLEWWAESYCPACAAVWADVSGGESGTSVQSAQLRFCSRRRRRGLAEGEARLP